MTGDLHSAEPVSNAKDSLRIAYYVSGHGFGHATRVCQITETILAQYSRISHISIISQAQPHIFDAILKGPFAKQIAHRYAEIDPQVVQPQPYAVDAATTTKNLHAYIEDLEKKVDGEVRWLKEHRIDIVLCDAPFMPCVAASKAELLCVMISNFTFAEVYSYFVEDLEKEGKPEEAQQLSKLVDRIIDSYSHSDFFLRLPGYLPNAGFQKVPLPSSKWVVDNSHFTPDVLSIIDRRRLAPTEQIHPPQSRCKPRFARRIIDAPLTVRPASLDIRANPSSRLALLTSLGVDLPRAHYPILLVAFNTHVLFSAPDPILTAHLLPPNWHAIVCGLSFNDSVRKTLPPGFYAAKPDAYIPDLMHIASVVIGKLGYGTVSESISGNTPFLYVPRSAFIEEFGLKRGITTFPGFGRRVVDRVEMPAKAVSISLEDFVDGRWREGIEAIYELSDKGTIEEGVKGDFVEDGGPQYEGVAATIDAGEFVARKVLEVYDEWMEL